jgi:hypothetical protein
LNQANTSINRYEATDDEEAAGATDDSEEDEEEEDVEDEDAEVEGMRDLSPLFLPTPETIQRRAMASKS